MDNPNISYWVQGVPADDMTLDRFVKRGAVAAYEAQAVAKDLHAKGYDVEIIDAADGGVLAYYEAGRPFAISLEMLSQGVEHGEVD